MAEKRSNGTTRLALDGGAMERGCRDINIISCVGQRALAVVSPIHTLVKRGIIKETEAEVTLLYTTEAIQRIAEESGEWLRRHFPYLSIAKYPFQNERSFFCELGNGRNNIMLNLDPGGNWQVATTMLHLSKAAVCFYSDTENLYLWNADGDIDNPDRKAVSLESIGLEEYNKLSKELTIKIRPGINRSLSLHIQTFLVEHDYDRSFLILRHGLDANLLATLNAKLIWAKERKGHLYLLFDLTKGQLTSGMLTNTFRLLTAILSPLNYFITVLTDDVRLLQRTRLEGVDAIELKSGDASWKERVRNWIEDCVVTQPKRVAPFTIQNKIVQSQPADIVQIGDNQKKILFVCLGDNIETTLKAIHSHDPDGVVLFYDATSPRITFLAERMAKRFSSIRFFSVRTDHVGRGIATITKKIIGQICARSSIDVAFNITPGTKSQAAVLSGIANRLGFGDFVFSVDASRIKPLNGSIKDFPVVSPSIAEILACQIAPLRNPSKRILAGDACSVLLKWLASGDIYPADRILRLQDRQKQSVCCITGKTSTGCQVRLQANGKSATYLLDESFFQPGMWWEAVVARAMLEWLRKSVYWGVTWSQVEGQRPPEALTELDVVFSLPEYVGVISCKTVRKKSLEIMAYLVKSEAHKRFGRFALPFVAVPYEEKGAVSVTGRIIDGVKIVTPSILADKGRLKSEIEGFVNHLRTNAKQRAL